MDDDYKKAYNSAVGMLARREHSRVELGRKLGQKGYESELVEGLLDTLEKDNFLSDERYTESYIYNRSNKGYGPLRIRRELQEKGVSDALIRQGFEEAEIDWFDLASSVRLKKFGAVPAEDWESRAKQMRFLQYRGFDQEQIQSCVQSDE